MAHRSAPTAAAAPSGSGARKRLATQHLNDIAKEIEDGGFPRHTKQEIVKILKCLESSIQSLIRDRRRLERIESDTVALKAGRYPPGVKPYNLTFESEIFDTQVNADGQPWTLTVAFETGTTFRQAKAQLYRAQLAAQKEFDAVVLRRLIKQHEDESDYDKFVKECVGVSKAEESAANELGLKLPPGLFDVEEQVSLKFARDLYRRCITQLSDAKKQDDAAIQAEEKKRDAKIDFLSKQKPEETLRKAVLQITAEERSKQNKKNRNKKDYHAFDQDIDYPKAASSQYDADQLGECLKPKPKPKPKPKSFPHISPKKHAPDKGKGKGKHKGKTYEQTKSKGKGKGMGKPAKGKGGASKGKGRGGPGGKERKRQK